MKKKLSTGILLSLALVIMLGTSCTKSADTSATISPDLPHIAETTTEIVTEPPTETDPPFSAVNVDLVMVGDILAHEGVYKSGYYPDGTVNFDHMFAHVTDDLQAADIAIVNQEVVLGGEDELAPVRKDFADRYLRNETVPGSAGSFGTDSAGSIYSGFAAGIVHDIASSIWPD